MIKDTIEQNENTTPNSQQMAVLKAHFPACFKADGSFDLERFKSEIAEKTNVVQEGYELKFLGKSYAKLLASTDTTTVIQPNEAHNHLPENANSENIYISGDNLDGLKHLLKSYSRSIKCIYIDPPYNTGSDGFVYFDNFNYNKDTLQEKLSVSEEEAERILDLTKRGSASHSAWLMFMYSRLLLARDLLTDDGVIFISIDDNEQANLKLLCDDVFGEENFVAQLVWEKGRKNDAKLFSVGHEYILVYIRNKDASIIWREEKPGAEEILNEYNRLKEIHGDDIHSIEIGIKEFYSNLSETDNQHPALIHRRYNRIDKKGIWRDDNISWPSPDGPRYEVIHPITKLPCKIPDTGWRFATLEKFKLYYDNGFIEFRNDHTETPILKRYLNFVSTDFDKDSKRKNNRKIGKEQSNVQVMPSVFYKGAQPVVLALRALMGGEVFSNPKDPTVIMRLVSYVATIDDTILDFFSGSATTAHAVLQLNAEDEGSRKFIAVQIPEALSPGNPSQKAAHDFLQSNGLPTTLDYIGIERIKRAAAKIREEQDKKRKEQAGELFQGEEQPALDLGFRHYVLAEPNQNTLDKLYSFDKAALLADTTIMEEFGKPTILATWLNADGYGLTARAEAIDLAGYTAYHCQKHLYLIDPGFTLESMKALLRQYDAVGRFNPENLVLFGYSFPDWSINEMVEKNLRILNDGEKNLKINFAVRY